MIVGAISDRLFGLPPFIAGGVQYCAVSAAVAIKRAGRSARRDGAGPPNPTFHRLELMRLP